MVIRSIVLAAMIGCVPQPAYHGAPDAGDPTTQDVVTVSIAGTGLGRIQSLPSGIDCPGHCSAAFSPTDAVALTLETEAGSSLTSWTGCDSSSGVACSVTGVGSHGITATLACATGSMMFATPNETGIQFTPVSCVTTLTIDATGARGGHVGGYGGRVVADVAVTSGDTFYVFVGGAGAEPSPSSPFYNGGSGGVNGGGQGGGHTQTFAGAGGGGGGASDVRRNRIDLASRILVAAGGGGGVVCPAGDGPGANGGTNVGTDAAIMCTSGVIFLAHGGTQTGGGAAGISSDNDPPGYPSCAAQSGSLATGGAGCGTGDSIGGGGGAGYYGGGGGAWTGGAGGSNLAPPGASINDSGVIAPNGNGLVTLSW